MNLLLDILEQTRSKGVWLGVLVYNVVYAIAWLSNEDNCFFPGLQGWQYLSGNSDSKPGLIRRQLPSHCTWSSKKPSFDPVGWLWKNQKLTREKQYSLSHDCQFWISHKGIQLPWSFIYPSSILWKSYENTRSSPDKSKNFSWENYGVWAIAQLRIPNF